jgi:acetyl-CoA C-acetyltransferase
MTHSIATMVDVLRRDPGAYGLVSGVGMHLTKHVFGVYSTTAAAGALAAPDQAAVQARVVAGNPARGITDVYAGPARVAAYTVAHGRDGAAEWGLAVCDVPDGTRAYAKVLDAELLDEIERDEWVGADVALSDAGNGVNEICGVGTVR